MMTSLFSIYDPSSESNFLNNWVIMFLFFLIVNQKFMLSNNLKVSASLLKYLLFNEMMIISKCFLYLFILPVFFFILLTNVVSLLPFVFTASSHMSFSLSLGLIMWVSLMMTGLINYNRMFAHLVPLGCPSVLMPFMVMIESVSLLIRPVTLSVRLAANLTAGHMIMVLLSMKLSVFLFLPSMMMEMVILTLEIAVSMIQPYVFFILLSLYAQEVEK